MRIVELPYHQLLRAQPTYRWWRPFVAVVLAAVFFFVVSLLLSIPVLVAVLASGTLDLTDADRATQQLVDQITPDTANPITLVFGLGSIAIVIFLIPLALRAAGIRPAGVRVNILHSVTMRLRMRWFVEALALSLGVWVVAVAVQLGIGVAAGEPLLGFTADPGTYAVALLVVLLLVPVQAATEEYLYRGVLMQAIGAWIRPELVGAVVAVAVSTVLFAFSHAYDAWGIVQVGMFGAAAAIATIRTGGLEAAIGLHVVNNIGSFVIAGTGATGETGITAESGGWPAALGQLVTMGVWLLAVELLARRRGVRRRSRIGVPDLGPGNTPAPVGG